VRTVEVSVRQGNVARVHPFPWSPPKLWEDTRDPLFVWREIARCCDATPPEPLPEWVIKYLGEAAREIIAADAAPDTIPRTRLARVLAALGFSGGRGKAGAYRQLDKLLDSINAAISTVPQLMRRRNIDKKRAARIIKEHQNYWKNYWKR
jgi:hypothetical protein